MLDMDIAISTYQEAMLEERKQRQDQITNAIRSFDGQMQKTLDSVGAGVHEKVLIVIEGRAANEALGRKGAPVDAAIIGIVDAVDVPV